MLVAVFSTINIRKRKSLIAIISVLFYIFVNNKLSCKSGIGPIEKMRGSSQMITMKNLTFLTGIIVVFGLMITVYCLIFRVVFSLIQTLLI